MTQSEQIVIALRKRWHTYGDMLSLHAGTCPWQRIAESGARYLRDGEVIERKKFGDGLVRLKVVRK